MTARLRRRWPDGSVAAIAVLVMAVATLPFFAAPLRVAVAMAVPLTVMAITGVIHAAIRPLCTVARLALGHTLADCGPCGTTHARAQYRTIAATGGLAYGRPRGATNGATDDSATLARSVGANRSTRGAAQGAADDRALASTHLLPQHRTCGGTDSATEYGFEFIGLGYAAQRRCDERAGGQEDCNGLARLCGVERESQHVQRVGLSAPYRQTWRFAQL